MVSVIIPTYNRSATIKRSIYSVLNQSYEDIELIVVDDCSSDDTEQVVSSISDPRLKYIRHASNLGACAARNTGIHISHGEYIAFQDSDDFWETNKLKYQINKMTEYNADICFCRIHRFGYSKQLDEFFPNFETGYISYKKLLEKSVVSTQTIVVKSDIARNYLFDVNVKRLQDYDWIIRAGEGRNVLFVKEAMVDMYLQKDSITNTGDRILLDTYEYFLNKYKNKFEEYPEFRIVLLETIVYYKTVLRMNASKECWLLFKYHKNIKSWVKWAFSKLGLLKMLKRYRNHN